MATRDIRHGTAESADTYYVRYEVVATTDGKDVIAPHVGGTVTTSSGATAGTPAHTADVTVDATAGGVTLLAANTNRKAAMIQNTGAANMRVSVGGTPTATNGIQVAPGQVLTLSSPYCPTGAIKAIREGATSTTAAPLEIT